MKIKAIDKEDFIVFLVTVEPELLKKWSTESYLTERKKRFFNQSYQRFSLDLKRPELKSESSPLYLNYPYKVIEDHADEIMDACLEESEDTIISENMIFLKKADEIGKNEEYTEFPVILYGCKSGSAFDFSSTFDKIEELCENLSSESLEKFKKKQKESQDELLFMILEEDQLQSSSLEPVDKEVESGDILSLRILEPPLDKETYLFEIRTPEDLDDNPSKASRAFKLNTLTEPALIGSKIGDTVTIADGYRDVVVEQIYKMEVPKIDDEFISEISEFDTIEEYKEAFFGETNMIKKSEALIYHAVEEYLREHGLELDRNDYYRQTFSENMDGVFDDIYSNELLDDISESLKEIPYRIFSETIDFGFPDYLQLKDQLYMSDDIFGAFKNQLDKLTGLYIVSKRLSGYSRKEEEASENDQQDNLEKDQLDNEE